MEPATTNAGLIIPNQGDLQDTWGTDALNPNFNTLDGYLCGSQIISVSNQPITLTAPSGFTPTPSGGPTQAQNQILSFTGSMTANVTVTLPLPGSYIVENLTTGNFLLTFAAANAGQVIAIDQGESVRIYNNGTNVRFCDLGRVGAREFWDGITSMPAWVNACTVPPYLLCDGSVYNFSTYPYLGARFKGAFGGNGITTFGVPDLQGRVGLPFDGTGTRITTAGSGLNGQMLGAALDKQTVIIAQSGLPNVAPTFTGIPTSLNQGDILQFAGGFTTCTVAVGGGEVFNGNTPPNQITPTVTPVGSISSINGGVAQTATPNVQPSQVTGIAVIRAA
jgi:microcystin-dependent protein